MIVASNRPGRIRASGLGDRIGALVWSGGIILVGLIALSAIVGSVGAFADMWGSGANRAGPIWMGVGVLVTAAGLGGLAVVVLLARRGHDALAGAIGFAAIVATRAIAVAAIPTPLQTDWAAYHDLAVTLAAGGGFDSARPPGWPVALSLLYRVGGPDPLLGELFNLACGVAVGVLVYLLARRSLGRVAAAAGLFLWAISPGPALFTVALASEFLFTALFIGAVALAVTALDRGWTAWVPVGVLLALSQYVRPVGLVLVPAIIVLPFLVGLPRRRAVVAAMTVVVAFAIVLSPSVAWQYQRYGRLTLSTSNYDGWSLLVGLNVTHGGRFNLDDAALVGADPRTVEWRDRSYHLAIERLTGHPESIAILAVPKFGVMWGDSTYGATWTIAAERPAHPQVAATLALLSQLAYTVAVALAAGFLYVRRRERDAVALLTILGVGAVALAEVFVEVQPRYHSPFEPLFCLLAGGAVAWLAERWGRRDAAETDDQRNDAGTTPDPVVTASVGARPTTSWGV